MVIDERKNILKEISKKSFKKKLKKLKTNEILLNNRYYLGDELGVGGLCTVYNASDIYCDYFNEPSNIVIKIPSKELRKNKDISAFMYSEYLFLKKINHKNIVKVLDFGIDEESAIPYIVLEYLGGETLSSYSIAQMDKKFKNHIFKTLLDSILYIHSLGIVHADLNPSNIMIDKNLITLFDFGISQYMEDDKETALEFKKVKAFNPKYCAPEVLLGEKPDIKSDIFSFACVMYELYNCKPLFKENVLNELKNNKYAHELSNIPFFLREWFKNSLSENPRKRAYPGRLSKFI